MSNSVSTTFLSNQPLFTGMSDEHLNFIRSCSEEVSFSEGDFLLRYHQHAECFFLLEKGRVVHLDHIPSGALRVIETLSAPNVIGWSWLLPSQRWHFSVKAIEDSQCHVVRTAPILEKMKQDKAFAAEIYQRFMGVVVDRLEASRLQNMDIYSNPSQGEGL